MTPDFKFGDDTLAERSNFASLRAPMRFAQIEDDPWATPAAVAALASRFTGTAEQSTWAIRLADSGAERIGHHGFFRAEFRDTLWAEAADWLVQAPRKVRLRS
jgi:predicted alpha/beta hydrolase